MQLVGKNNRAWRQFAGNVCLVLFLSFLTTTFLFPVGLSKAYANQQPSLEVLENQVSVEGDQLKIYMLLKPTTDTHFDSVFVDLTGVTGETQVVKAVYKQVYESIYGDIYGYEVNLVYNLPEGATVEYDPTPVYITDASGNLIQTDVVSLVVKPPQGQLLGNFILDLEKDMVTIGENVYMNIGLDSDRAISAAEYVLRYDPQVFEYVSYTPAQGLPETRILKVDGQKGEVAFAVGSTTSLGAAVDFGRFEFKAKTAGAVDFEVVPMDVIDIYEHQIAVQGAKEHVKTIYVTPVTGRVILVDRFDSDYSNVLVHTQLSHIAPATTDTTGRYNFNLYPGAYELVATHPRHLTIREQLTVGNDGTPVQLPDMQMLSGDANGDNKVSLYDLIALAWEYNQTSSSGIYLSSDFNGDGKAGVLDLIILADNWRAVGE